MAGNGGIIGPLKVIACQSKVHTFTADGTLAITNCSSTTASEILVVAGGGAGGISTGAGGGGAGGYRTATCVPISNGQAVTVGAGGSGTSPSAAGTVGANSVFGCTTSAGGGYGGWQWSTPEGNGSPGGSGGGARYNPGATGGTGNTPPVSPAQGTNGGAGSGVCYTGSVVAELVV